jgi:hypothetical protein
VPSLVADLTRVVIACSLRGSTNRMPVICGSPPALALAAEVS